MSLLDVRGLRVAHVGPVDLRVGAGEAVTLAGPSGSGKTLILRAIADLVPHDGDCRLNGRPAESMPPSDWRRAVGYLPAESAWWHDTVGPHFPEPPEHLDALGFAPEVMDWAVARLSSGERQRLALLRLLARRPRMLLLDEPTANLDRDNIDAVERLLADYRGDGAGMLWVGHDARQLERVGTRGYRLTVSGRLA